MRDPKRIDEFCDELKVIWHRFPDLRFGQLFAIAAAQSKSDPFYVEDDKMIELLKEVEKLYALN